LFIERVLFAKKPADLQFQSGFLKQILIAAPRPFRLSFVVSESGNFVKYWLPLLVWMVLIFSASADKASYQHSSTLFVPFIHWLFPHLPARQVDALHHFFRKCAHFMEYAILALLIRRTLINVFRTTFAPWGWRLVGAVVFLVFLYASSDEFHQSFVPGRTPLFTDVMIDTAGGTTGLALIWLENCLLKKRRA